MVEKRVNGERIVSNEQFQMFLRRLDDQTTSNTQEAMDRLTVPRQEATVVKKEGKRRMISFRRL